LGGVVHALGATLFEMLLGSTPAPGALIEASDLDPALIATVNDLLVVNPRRRPADAVALGDELVQIAERLREKRPGY
jgi:hypothetical protein